MKFRVKERGGHVKADKSALGLIGIDSCISDSVRQVWAGPLSGQRLVVALWNRCSKAATITAPWGVLGLESSTSVSVRDLWQVRNCVCIMHMKSLKNSKTSASKTNLIYSCIITGACSSIYAAKFPSKLSFEGYYCVIINIFSSFDFSSSKIFGILFESLKALNLLLNSLDFHKMLTGYPRCFQHKEVTADVVASFGARVDAHDCHMYIFTPQTVARSVI